MNVKLEVTNLITPITNTLKVINDEWKNLLDIGIYEYLQSQTEKYYFTNTFLHRNEKVRFRDIYYPITVKYNHLETKIEKLDELFDEYKNITLIGVAGSGKSTVVKHLFLSALEQNYKVPILIELRHLNDYKGNIKSLITEKILNSRIKPTKGILQRALKSGKFLFLLDGYDEIFSDKKQEVNSQIESFVDSYSQNNFVITTRPGSGIERFPRFHDFKVQSLSKDDVSKFIDKLVTNEERKKRILRIVEDPKNDNYSEYLNNPLLLSMFILAFESHPEIPSRKSSFYRNVFDTLYSKHDGITKNSFPREKLTKLQRDQFEKVLSTFSYLSLLEGRYAYTHEYLSDKLSVSRKSVPTECDVEDLIYDLRTSISVLLKDGFEYKFPHRSLQEYFTALFISKLPSNKKSKAYKNVLAILKESSSDYSFTFWNLCKELDEVAFTKNFLIPQLKSLQAKLKNKEKAPLIKAYFKIIEPRFLYRSFHPEEDKNLKIYRHASYNNSLMDFCKVYDYDDVWKFPLTSKCEAEILKLYPKEEKGKKSEQALSKFETEIHKNDKVIEILLNNGFDSLIESISNNLDSTIIELEKSIEFELNNIDELLER